MTGFASGSSIVFARRWEDYLLVEPWFDCFDYPIEAEEHSQGCQLSLHAGSCEFIFVPAFDTEAMDVSPAEFVEIVDTVLFTPLDELCEPIPVRLDGSVREFVAPFVKVHLHGLYWGEWFEFVCDGSLTEGRRQRVLDADLDASRVH